MNKTLLVLLTALIIAACTAPPTNREATSTANTNKAAAANAAAPLTEADASAREKEVWTTIEKKDTAAFAANLLDDFIYVSGTGVSDKAATVKGISDSGTMSNLAFSDWKLVPIDKDAAVLVYKLKGNGAMNGQTVPFTSYASTLYVNRGGKWQALYHQDCDESTAPPPPPAKAPTPSANASPAATATPATMSSDVVANEKAVWAALMGRHWDLFESYLASDALEVEPIGIADRAASVKGVQTVDFSKTTLSDWKTVKIDDDAAIVTYVAHFPGLKPDTEYHSTVWANRNGKWSAVFHHGTPKSTQQPAPAKSAQK
jgi:hypothetical protein